MAWFGKDYKPKYVAKVPIGNNKYRYFYTNIAYQAYLKRQNTTNRFSNIKNDLLRAVMNTSSNVKSSFKTGVSKTANHVSTAKKWVTNKTTQTYQSAKNAYNKTASNTKQFVTTQKNKTVASITNSYNKTTTKVSNSINEAKKFVKSIPDRTLESANKAVKSATPAVNKKIEDINDKVNDYYSDNIYYARPWNIDEKREKVSKTKEWQDIVKREDPEYVRTAPDGSKHYLIDDYIVKKKHPGLDIVDDLANGRNITVNEITKDAITANAKEYLDTAQLAMGTVSYLLMQKFKISQGSYKDEIDAGMQYVEKNVQTANVIYSDLKKVTSSETINSMDTKALADVSIAALNYAQNGLDQRTINTISNAAMKTAMKSLAKDSVNGVSEADVKRAVKEAAKDALGGISDAAIDNIVEGLTDDILEDVERRRKQIYG